MAALSVGSRVRRVRAIPEVVVTVRGLPAGVRWTLTGSGGGREWIAGRGSQVAGAAEVTLVDPLAPLGVPVSYTVACGAESAAAALPVVRDVPGLLDALVSWDGRSAAHLMRAHSDPRSYDSDHEVVRVAGRRDQIVIAPSTVWEAPAVIRCRTIEPHTEALRSMVGQRVVLLHNASAPGRMRASTVRPIVAGVLTDAEEDLSAWKNVEGRSWNFTVTPTVVPWDHVVPAVTWADAAAHFGLFGAAAGLTGSWIASGEWMEEQ